jgi:CxxC-x17-CxxC domain-containing protein
MEQHRDEHIDCADCGASFVFSAAEAAVFAERGLTSPKRCKECRRARKQGARPDGGRADHGGDRGGRWGQPPAYQGQGFQGGRRGAPSYTGDVNEYRSPMADGNAWRGGDAGPPHRANGYAPRGDAGPGHRTNGYAPRGDAGPGHRANGYAPRGGSRPGPGPGQRPFHGNGAAPHRNDEYRSPMPDRGYPRYDARAGGRNGDGFAPFHDGPRPAFRQDGPRPPRHDDGERRRRPAADMFQITCDSCGAQAEVPFKPAEGREVFCQPCYRARKPQ